MDPFSKELLNLTTQKLKNSLPQHLNGHLQSIKLGSNEHTDILFVEEAHFSELQFQAQRKYLNLSLSLNFGSN